MGDRSPSFVVRGLHQELVRRLHEDPRREGRCIEGDGELVERALWVVCMNTGISPHEYWSLLERDAALLQLHSWAVTEAIVGTSDPGPYDQISRESPTGTPTNEHWNAWMQRGNSP
ncbi:MAG TPA: hypothetical protein VJT73_13235 [Polyangiaceae bacterium]|nr:hypothetical protein [Polyangiaceae bacterium]